MSFPELSEADVRSMIRLVGDVAVCRGGAAEKSRVLMDGLARIIDAQKWLWTRSSKAGIRPGKPMRYTAAAHGGFGDGDLPKLLKAIDHAESRDIFSAFMEEIRRSNLQHTWTRVQMDKGERFLRSGVRELWQEAGVGDLLVSAFPVTPEDFSAVALYRVHGKGEFGVREARIVHIVLAEVPWLHETRWFREDRLDLLPKLSPRRREVLNLVLEGHARKEMAGMLGISAHTLDGYVKDIFRHFRVHSQVELIARFRSGSSGNTPGSGG